MVWNIDYCFDGMVIPPFIGRYLYQTLRMTHQPILVPKLCRWAHQIESQLRVIHLLLYKALKLSL